MTETFDDLFVTEKEHRERSTFHPYNKDAWLANKKQEKADAFAMLEEATKALAEGPEAFMTYLETQARFDRYSVSNCLLIAKQKPDAVKLADYNTWKENNIQVNKGENGIVILEPGNEYTREDGTTGVNVNTKKVFDMSQTDAADSIDENKSYDIRKVLKALMAESPVDMKIADDLPETVQGTYKKEDNAIYIRRGMDGNNIFRTMAYEICLVKMEQKGDSNAYVAQAATYLLCQRFGINDMLPNFKNSPQFFAGKDAKAVRADLERMRSLANEISQPMMHTLEKAEKVRSDGAR